MMTKYFLAALTVKKLRNLELIRLCLVLLNRKNHLVHEERNLFIAKEFGYSPLLLGKKYIFMNFSRTKMDIKVLSDKFFCSWTKLFYLCKFTRNYMK